MDSFESARITVVERVTDDDVTVDVEYDGDLPLVHALGLLRLAEDTIIRERMGEVPDEDDQ